MATAVCPKVQYRNGKEHGRKTAGVKAFLQSKSSTNDLFIINRFQGIVTESAEAVSGCLLELFSFLKTNP